MSVDHSELPKPPQSSAASLSVVTLKLDLFSEVGAICKHDDNNDDDDGDVLKLWMDN